MTLRRTLLLGATVPLLALPSLFIASCADSDEATTQKEDASTTVQPVVDASDDVVDAGPAPPCDAGDPSCVGELLDCNEADFCPVSTPIDRRYVLTAVWGAAANDVWAAGSGGTIVHWNGTAWTLVPSNTTETFHTIWGSGPSDVWIAGSTATLLHGAGVASTFTREPPFQDGRIYNGRVYAIWGASADGVRVGGEPFSSDLLEQGLVGGNHLLRTPDGTGWEIFQGLDFRWMGATVRAIWGSSADDVWFSLDDGASESWARGTLAHGVAPAPGEPLVWTSIDSQSVAALESLWGSSAGDVWAVGAAGTIRRWATGAKQWARVENAPSLASFHAVWGSGPNDVWVVGDAGTILHFDGTTWITATVAFPLGPKPNLTGVWGSGPNDVWVVGEGFALHFTGKKGGK
jgi:hypothetical protein